MNSLEANIRENITKGQLNAIRNNGNVPAIIYGGKDPNQKISIEKKAIKSIVNSDTFLSKVLELDIDGKKEKVIPRDIAFHVVSEEPIHIDFMRIVSGKKIILEIPVKFINHPDSPGLKRGGVLLSLLILPLYVPVLIFGVMAVDAVTIGSGGNATLMILGASTLFSLAITPWAAAAAIICCDMGIPS